MTAEVQDQVRPAQLAIDKLGVIPVFTLAKSVSELCVGEQDGVNIVPLYLSHKAAQETLDAYKSSMPDFDASVIYFTLDKMYSIIEFFKAEYAKQSKELIFPIVVRKENTEKAVELLKAEGMSDADIQSNLEMPVFFTEPMITIDSSELGKKQVFFIDYVSLENALDNLPDSTAKPAVKVANLQQIIDIISESQYDLYEFYPTPEFESLKKIEIAQLELLKASWVLHF